MVPPHRAGAITVDVSGAPLALRPVELHRFFSPATVAVIGANDTPGRPTTAMWNKIKTWAERAGAELIPVNPNRTVVDGLDCLSHPSELPEGVDLAVILVADAVTTFEELADRHPHFAVVFAAGFAEAGAEGIALQRRLEQAIAESSTRVLGPNTNLNAFEAVEPTTGPTVALITQSGHQGRPVFQSQRWGLPLKAWAPTGNEVDLEFADFANWFADQPDVAVVAAYIEGFKSGRTLMLAADHCAERGVALVVVKVGRTEAGTSMAASHTGHLAGADRIVDAAFDRLGVIRVDGLDELADTSAFLARNPHRPPSTGVAIYSISGGTGAHVADLAASAGLSLPLLEPSTQRHLHTYIEPFLRVSNPIDSGGGPTMDSRGRHIIDAILDDPNIGTLLVPITGALPALSIPLARDLIEAAKTHPEKTIVVVWGSPDLDDPTYTDVLVPSDLSVFRTVRNAIGAISARERHHHHQATRRSPFGTAPVRRSRAASPVRDLLDSYPEGVLSEARSRQVLEGYGIPTAPGRLVGTGAEAARAFADLGPRVVMKACGSRLAHKSDRGLVRLDITSAAEARRTFRSLMNGAGDDADGVLICEMAEGPGVETVLGLTRDALFGPVVMFGLGGVLVEALNEVHFGVPPMDRAEAHRLVRSATTAHRLLREVRGAAACDIEALVDAILRIQRLGMEQPSIVEIDVNPLFVTSTGAVALDALVRIDRNPSTRSPE